MYLKFIENYSVNTISISKLQDKFDFIEYPFWTKNIFDIRFISRTYQPDVDFEKF